MKLWAMVLSVMMAASASSAAEPTDVIQMKDPDGGATLAMILLCNDCQSPAGKKACYTGAEKGWLDGKPCGSCLVNSNYGVLVRYPYDVHFKGKLVDDEGKPKKERFVKLFLPNGWTVRTRTTDEGEYRMMLGATADRKGKKPLVVDLGTRVDAQTGEDANFSIYMMPEGYKPCEEDPAKGKGDKP